jgi:hypothetical protein
VENEEVGEVGYEADEAEGFDKLEAVVRGESSFAGVCETHKAVAKSRGVTRILRIDACPLDRRKWRVERGRNR